MSEIITRLPADKNERLMAGLCSTTDDLLYSKNGRIVVTGVLPCGDRIYLGDIAEIVLYEKNSPCKAMVERIRFGG